MQAAMETLEHYSQRDQARVSKMTLAVGRVGRRIVRLSTQGDEPSFFETGRTYRVLYSLRSAAAVRPGKVEYGRALLLQGGPPSDLLRY